MKIRVYMVCYNEEEILPYALRHYNTFADRVTIFDAGSTDRSREIAREMGAEVVHWDTKGEMNTQLDMELKSSCWRGCGADWVIVVDTDELIYFPEADALEAHDSIGTAVIKTTGWDMVSDVFPTTKGQIYDEVKFGASENYWYGKPAIFAPSRLQDLQFGAGAHDCHGKLAGGMPFKIAPDAPPSSPPVYLLHFKHLGPVERIAENNRGKRERLAAINVKMRWGNFDDPLKHAQDKRTKLLAGLRRVVQ